MKKKKSIAAGALTLGIMSIGGLTALAASGFTESSSRELEDVEYNNKIYAYAVEKKYETDDPESEIAFDEREGWKIAETSYETLDIIIQQKTLEESKDYKNLLEKDEGKIADTITIDGNTYNLQNVSWSEEPNIEHVSYTQDYGYAASEPEHPAVHEYTYTSPVTNEENTVILPFARMEHTDYGWVDGFTATITFRNLDGVYFKLGSHEFAYDADRLSLTDSDYEELVKMLGYDTSKYRLNSASWSGKPYKGKNGEKYRDAIAAGQQYAASFHAVYEDDVENGKIYAAHATYTCEVDVPADEAAPAYVMQATAYYEKEQKKIPLVMTVGIVILAAFLVGVLYVLSRGQKKKMVSSSQDSTDVQDRL